MYNIGDKVELMIGLQIKPVIITKVHFYNDLFEKDKIYHRYEFDNNGYALYAQKRILGYYKED